MTIGRPHGKLKLAASGKNSGSFAARTRGPSPLYTLKMESPVAAWAARIAATGMFCAGVLAGPGAKAELLVLRCSIGGQEPSAPLNVDLTNRTINTGKEAISAEVNSQVITWH